MRFAARYGLFPAKLVLSTDPDKHNFGTGRQPSSCSARRSRAAFPSVRRLAAAAQWIDRLQRQRRLPIAPLLRSRLDKCGLRRGKSATDGRKQALYLEAPGVAILGKAKQAVFEHENWLKARFTARETKQLIALLSRIHG